MGRSEPWIVRVAVQTASDRPDEQDRFDEDPQEANVLASVAGQNFTEQQSPQNAALNREAARRALALKRGSAVGRAVG